MTLDIAISFVNQHFEVFFLYFRKGFYEIEIS